MGQQIGADAGAGIDADTADRKRLAGHVPAAGAMAGMVQRRPGQFQQQPRLRVDQRGFARRIAEQAGIEAERVVEQALAADIARIGDAVIGVKLADALAGLDQQPVQRRQIPGAGHPAGHADDRDIGFGGNLGDIVGGDHQRRPLRPGQRLFRGGGVTGRGVTGRGWLGQPVRW